MNFVVNVLMSRERLGARLRAIALAGRIGTGEAATRVGLPSSSGIRDPAEILTLSRFDEVPRQDG